MKRKSEYFRRRMRELTATLPVDQPASPPKPELEAIRTDDGVTIIEVPSGTVPKSRRFTLKEYRGKGAHGRRKQDVVVFNALQEQIRAEQSPKRATRLSRMAKVFGTDAGMISDADQLSSKKSKRIAQRSKSWRENNREKWTALQNAHNALRYARETRQCPSWADKGAIREVYLEARRRTVAQNLDHEVDHVIPLHGRYVSGLHVHWNLRIIPASENLEKRNYWTPTQESFRNTPIAERPGGEVWKSRIEVMPTHPGARK